MTMPLSGEISLDNARTELGYGSSSIALNDTDVRRLFSRSGAISEIGLAHGYGKLKPSGIPVTWPTNLVGGSPSVKTSGVVLGSDAGGTPLYNGDSIRLELTFTAAMSYGFPTGGTYIYFYFVHAPFYGYTNGVPSYGAWEYPLWTSYSVGSGYYAGGYLPGGGPANNRKNDAYSISNLVWATARLGARAPYYSNYDIRSSSDLYPGGAIYYPNGTWPLTIPVTFTNYSGTDQWVGSYVGANGTNTPVLLAYYSQFNGWQTQSSNIQCYATAYGKGLVSSLTINGSTVTYTAPNGATQAQVIAGFKSAINSAGISGVTAIDYTNGLGIVGASSVTFGSSENRGSSNYTPTIGSYQQWLV